MSRPIPRRSQRFKRDYQRFLHERNRGKKDCDGRPDREPEDIARWAREHDLPYDDGHVRFPDARIEYEDRDGCLRREAGLRCGEMIALQWRDVDLGKRQICVQRSDWNGQLTTPKADGCRMCRSRCDSRRRSAIFDIYGAPTCCARTMASR